MTGIISIAVATILATTPHPVGSVPADTLAGTPTPPTQLGQARATFAPIHQSRESIVRIRTIDSRPLTPTGLRSVQDTVVVERRKTGPLILTVAGLTSLLAGLLTDSDGLTIAGAAVAGIGVYLYFR